MCRKAQRALFSRSLGEGGGVLLWVCFCCCGGFVWCVGFVLGFFFMVSSFGPARFAFVDSSLQLVVLDDHELVIGTSAKRILILARFRLGRIGETQEQTLASHFSSAVKTRGLCMLVALPSDRNHIGCIRVQVERGNAKLLEAGNGDITGGPQGSRQNDGLPSEGLSFDLAMASCIPACSSRRNVSWTRRCARPTKAMSDGAAPTVDMRYHS